MKKSLAWMAFAQATSFLTQFSATVVLARYLSPKEVGVAAVAFAIIGVVSLFQQLGLPSLIVREEVLTDDISSTAFTVNALVTVFLSAAIALISFAGASFLRDAGVQQALLVLAISPLFGIFAFLPSAHLERAGHFKALALIGTIGGIVSASATIFFAILGFSYMSVAYAQVLSSAVTAVILMTVGCEHIRHRIGFRAWRRITNFSFQMLVVSGINTASQRLSEIVLGRLLGLTALGLFNRANGINGLIWNNIHLAAGRVILVDYAELHRQGVPLRERYLHTVAIVTGLLWPAFAGLAVVARPFILLVYGEAWLPAVAPFELIAISSMILVSVTMTWELFTAAGELATQTRIEAVKAFFGFVAFTIGCLISLEAAAAARIVEAVYAFFIYRPHVNRMTATRTADYWPIYAQGLLATGLAIAPAAAVMIVAGKNDPSLLMLGSSILLGIILWILGLFAMRHPLAREVWITAQGRLRLSR